LWGFAIERTEAFYCAAEDNPEIRAGAAPDTGFDAMLRAGIRPAARRQGEARRVSPYGVTFNAAELMVTGKPLIKVVALIEYEPVHVPLGTRNGRVRL
jgi:hypothetical protein